MIQSTISNICWDIVLLELLLGSRDKQTCVNKQLAYALLPNTHYGNIDDAYGHYQMSKIAILAIMVTIATANVNFSIVIRGIQFKIIKNQAQMLFKPFWFLFYFNAIFRM